MIKKVSATGAVLAAALGFTLLSSPAHAEPAYADKYGYFLDDPYGDPYGKDSYGKDPYDHKDPYGKKDDDKKDYGKKDDHKGYDKKDYGKKDDDKKDYGKKDPYGKKDDGKKDDGKGYAKGYGKDYAKKLAEDTDHPDGPVVDASGAVASDNDDSDFSGNSLLSGNETDILSKNDTLIDEQKSKGCGNVNAVNGGGVTHCGDITVFFVNFGD